MDNLIGLFGREELVGDLVAEIKKGKHVILTGPVGTYKCRFFHSQLPTTQAAKGIS